MTVLTTVMGMLPLSVLGGAGAELYQGLGAVIVGGLAFSTLFSLFFVPVLISLGQDAREAWGTRRKAAGTAELSMVQA
jgi:HAE1 family hydrophobic/amphiphilic exporter-1